MADEVLAAEELQAVIDLCAYCPLHIGKRITALIDRLARKGKL